MALGRSGDRAYTQLANWLNAMRIDTFRIYPYFVLWPEARQGSHFPWLCMRIGKACTEACYDLSTEAAVTAQWGYDAASTPAFLSSQPASHCWCIFAIVVSVLPLTHIQLIEHHSQDLGPGIAQTQARFADDLFWCPLRVGHQHHPVHHRR